MPKKLELAGKRFGRLLVIEESSKDAHGAYMWSCRCDCGVTTSVRGSHLKSGVTRSCGCGAREALQASLVTHGMTDTPLYQRWRSMINRVSLPANKHYRNYGGRGIKACNRWLSFENFAEDMGSTFVPDLELDRVDVNGDYSPGNCRWATRVEQQRNRRNNHLVTFGRKTCTVQEWGELLEVKPNTIITRLRRGWSVERALSKGIARDVLLHLANEGES